MDESSELLDHNDNHYSNQYKSSIEPLDYDDNNQNNHCSYKPKNCLHNTKCFTVLYGIFVSLMILSINSYSYIIAKENTNHTCYETQYDMSLSRWLSLTTSVAIASNVLMILFSFVMLIDCRMEDKFFGVFIAIPMLIYLIFASFFSFVMTITGIIELSYQYDNCIKEVKNVTIMVILTVTINLFYSFVGLCGHKRTK